MEEQIILLKDFIFRCPATHAEHQQAEARLMKIASQHQELKKELKKEQDTNDWLRKENEKLQNQLKSQDNEERAQKSVDQQQD